MSRTMKAIRIRELACLAVMIVGAVESTQIAAADKSPSDVEALLVAAYPKLVKGVEGNDLVLFDGSRLPLNDGKGVKNADDWLDHPDIKDMFRFDYPAGAAFMALEKDFDPGRAHNEAFFSKIYGNCRNKDVQKNLVDVIWLRKKWGAKLAFSRINGAAEQLQKVSDELDQLPKRFNGYLYPTAGTYNCRTVAGTKSMSSHSYGIAIDIALKRSAYWRWNGIKHDGGVVYASRFPLEIIEIFEKHGFIWGGRWYHYDTMHFEYRPELIPLRPTFPETNSH
jgi:hypothetical protein